MRTTTTGIPIELCGKCGYEHPITRKHCITCNHPTLFIRDDGICVGCNELNGQTSILEVTT